MHGDGPPAPLLTICPCSLISPFILLYIFLTKESLLSSERICLWELLVTGGGQTRGAAVSIPFKSVITHPCPPRLGEGQTQVSVLAPCPLLTWVSVESEKKEETTALE